MKKCFFLSLLFTPLLFTGCPLDPTDNSSDTETVTDACIQSEVTNGFELQLCANDAVVDCVADPDNGTTAKVISASTCNSLGYKISLEGFTTPSGKQVYTSSQEFATSWDDSTLSSGSIEIYTIMINMVPQLTCTNLLAELLRNPSTKSAQIVYDGSEVKSCTDYGLLNSNNNQAISTEDIVNGLCGENDLDNDTGKTCVISAVQEITRAPDTP